ncbi:hypothetical protein CALCODRAFT_134144 [Calocera cornea HHB12733]|uniref:Uncharacterized protein n=1 Tax=Calocera cornea HHB12733 TaxID=1353952 RepID=A0A165CVN6_9BASI|nr:hypothetical protein CALCODRAFT_134144 [Calocera cornea HHB12733]
MDRLRCLLPSFLLAHSLRPASFGRQQSAAGGERAGQEGRRAAAPGEHGSRGAGEQGSRGAGRLCLRRHIGLLYPSLPSRVRASAERPGSCPCTVQCRSRAHKADAVSCRVPSAEAGPGPGRRWGGGSRVGLSFIIAPEPGSPLSPCSRRGCRPACVRGAVGRYGGTDGRAARGKRKRHSFFVMSFGAMNRRAPGRANQGCANGLGRGGRAAAREGVPSAAGDG